MLALNWNHGGISGDVHFAGHNDLRSNRPTVGRDKISDISYYIHMKCAEQGGREDCNWKPLM